MEKEKKSSFIKSPRFFGIVGFIIILLALPITLYLVQQQQETRQRAANFAPVNGTNFSINAKEGTPCPDGQQNKVSSYGGIFEVTSKKNQTVNVVIHRFFCPSGSVQSCGENESPPQVIGSKTFTTGQMIPFTADTYSPVPPYTGQACGTYQVDLEFVGFNSYTYQSAFWCHTNIDCKAATPTPSNTPVPSSSPTPTDTPSVTPTPSDTPTPTETPTPIVTETPTPFPTGTPNPSATPTPTTTPGPTNTPNPSATVTPTPPPGSTNTPTVPPTVIVRKPTLPPTGPENNGIVLTGVAGAVITILGALLLLGL